MTPQSGNVFAADVVDRGPWLLYDRNTTAVSTATPANYFFFTSGLSATKTKSDTNVDANQLPPPRAFSVQSIGFIFAPIMFFSDVWNLMKNYYFEFKIGVKIFAEGPLQLFPGGGGISAAVSTNHATTSLLQVMNNGDPSLLSCRRFPDYPRIIPANVRFYLNVIQGAAVFTTFAAVAATIVSPAYGGVDLMAILDGILDREVM
jgi:hypothetical protein